MAPTQPAADTASSILILIASIAGTALSIAIGAVARIFSPRHLRGNERLDSNQQPGVLMPPLLIGAGATFLFAPLLFHLLVRRAMPAADQPLSPLQSAAMQLFATTAGLICVLVTHQLLQLDVLKVLGLSVKHVQRAIIPGILGFLFATPWVLWIGAFSALLWRKLRLEHDTAHPILELMHRSEDWRIQLILIMTAALIVPLVEELLLRGHLQTFFLSFFCRRVRQRPPAWGAPATSVDAIWSADLPVLPYPGETCGPAIRWFAIILTSLLFASLHPWWSIPPIFFLSLCLGYLYERTNNLWAPIITHALFNSFSITLSFFVKV